MMVRLRILNVEGVGNFFSVDTCLSNGRLMMLLWPGISFLVPFLLIEIVGKKTPLVSIGVYDLG